MAAQERARARQEREKAAAAAAAAAEGGGGVGTPASSAGRTRQPRSATSRAAANAARRRARQKRASGKKLTWTESPHPAFKGAGGKSPFTEGFSTYRDEQLERLFREMEARGGGVEEQVPVRKRKRKAKGPRSKKRKGAESPQKQIDLAGGTIELAEHARKYLAKEISEERRRRRREKRRRERARRGGAGGGSSGAESDSESQAGGGGRGGGGGGRGGPPKLPRVSVADRQAAEKVLDKLRKMLDQRDNFVRVIDIFRKIDANGDGTLSPAELVRGLRRAGLECSSSVAKSLHKLLDKDSDGRVAYEELLKGYKNRGGAMRKR